MVVMQTLLTSSSLLDCIRWTLYSSVKRRFSSGVRKLLELGQGLASEVAAVHQEQDALGPRVLDQPVDKIAGRECLAPTACHLDQSSGAICGERLLKVANS